MTSTFVRARRRADGVTTYRVIQKVRVDGEWRMQTLASGLTSPRDAERIRRGGHLHTQEVRAGLVTWTPTTPATPTIKELVDAYLKHISMKPGHGSAESTARLHVLPTVGSVEIGKLKRGDVQRLIDAKVHEGLAPQTVRHVLSVLRAAINHALRRSTWEGTNPTSLIDLPRINRRIQETLTLDELPWVLRYTRDEDRTLFTVAAYTGLRPGELMALRWIDVDLTTRMVRVRRSNDRDQPKDGDERLVPLAQFLVPLLDELPRSSVHVFPSPGGGMRGTSGDEKLTRKLRTAMARACKAGGPESLCTAWRGACRWCHKRETFKSPELRCEGCDRRFTRLMPLPRPMRFYDLRHTAASAFIAAGVSPGLVSEILGHHDEAFTMRVYVTLRPETLRAAADRLNPVGAPLVPATKRKPLWQEGLSTEGCDR